MKRPNNLPKNKDGELNPHWKGGIHYRKDGYIMVHAGVKRRGEKGAIYKLQHRIIMEEKIGRPLLRSEVVHHIDGNRANNNPDNLEILTTQAVHAKIHYDKRARNDLGRFL